MHLTATLLLQLHLSAVLAGAGPRLTATASVEPKAARPGDTVELRIDCQVEKGWHVYAPDQSPEAGTPIALALEKGLVVPAGKIAFPAPKVHKDEFVGEVRSLEGKFRLTQPLRIDPGAAPGKVAVKGSMAYQACTATSCELATSIPVMAELEVLPPAAGDGGAKSVPSGEPGAKDPATPPGLPALPGTPEAEGEKAAVATAKKGPGPVQFTAAVEPATVPAGGRGELVLSYQIAKGFHIYPTDHKEEIGKPTKVILDESVAKPAGAPSMKPGPVEEENFGMKEKVLVGTGVIRQAFTLSPELKPGPEKIAWSVEYQVCDDKKCADGTARGEAAVVVGPPAAARVDGGVKPADGGGPAAAPNGPAAAAGAPAGGAPQGGWLAFILLAIGGGLFALIMPCTYPIIPITISFFTKQAEARKTSVLPLALAYGAGIVLDFVLIGLLVGPPIQKFAAHPVTNVVFGVLFIAFGLSLLGLFVIQLPSSVNALASKASGKQGYLGVFLLGSTLVITSFTCTAPIMGALLAAGAGFSPFQVAVGTGVFGLTMALPFVGLALFPTATRKLPKSGEWLHTVKVTLGFVELAAALKFISNADVVEEWHILPRELFMAIVAVVLAVTAVYLFGMIRLHGDSGEVGPGRVVSGLAFLVIASYFLLWGFTGPQGNKWLDFVMSAFAPPYTAAPAERADAGKKAGAKKPAWTIVEDDFEKGMEVARAEKKLALVNWTGVT